MKNIVDYIKVAVLVLLITTSIISWIVGVGVLDSSIFTALVLMLVGTVTGVLAKIWIYGI